MAAEDHGWFTVVYIMPSNPADVGDVFPEWKTDTSLVLSRVYLHYPHTYKQDRYYDDDLDKWIPERRYSYTREDILEQAIDHAKSWYYHAQYGPDRNTAVIDHTGKIHAIVEFTRSVRRRAGE